MATPVASSSKSGAGLDTDSTEFSTKRPRIEDQEFQNLAEISPTKRAKIHGFLETLSPIKDNVSRTRKYFTGKITDGKVSRRLVGFDPKVHQALSTYKSKQQAVALSNCEVKESNFSPDLEILVRKSTDMQKSPLKFDVDPTTLEEGKEPFISLD